MDKLKRDSAVALFGKVPEIDVIGFRKERKEVIKEENLRWKKS